MDTTAEPTAEPVEPPAASSSSSPPEPSPSPVSRRGFLRTAGAVGVAGMAASLAACQATAAPSWAFASAVAATPTPSPTPSRPRRPRRPRRPARRPRRSRTCRRAGPSTTTTPRSGSAGSSATSPGPSGCRAFLDNVQGPNTDDPEFTKVVQGNQPLEPVSVDVDGTKVFALTIDEIDWPIDALLPPVKALGYNETWPGPTIRVIEGDRVRITFTNNLPASTGVHFHGIEFDDFTQDGVPFFTQLPIVPGESMTYEFTATPRGLAHVPLAVRRDGPAGPRPAGRVHRGARRPADRYPRKNGVTQEVVFIHGDTLGGFTINGHGFPATTPIVAKLGDKVLIRFMNEGTLMHPWHTHGHRMQVVARDGAQLGSAAFRADTLGVNPGERWDAIIDCDRPGVWPIHCHIMPNVDGQDGMYGMVTALVVLAPDAT